MWRHVATKLCVTALLALVFLGTSLVREASAAKGVVVYNRGRCDYFIVQSLTGFALLQWFGGNDPSEGDVLVGDFESYGFKDIYNVTADAEVRVWVDNYMLSKTRVVEKYLDKCN